MAFLQWRRFNFFDKEILRHPDREDYFDCLKDINISSSTCGKGYYIFGDFDGFLHFLTYDMEMQSMKVYDVKVTHLYQMTNHCYIISVGQDNASPNPIVKIWNLEKGFDKYGQIPCVRNVKVTFGTKIPIVSCIVAHENLSALMVGLTSGHLLLYRGNFIRERNPSSSVKPRLFYQATSPITNLALAYTQRWEKRKMPTVASSTALTAILSSRPSAASLQESAAVPAPKRVSYTVLYVTTLDSVLSFTLSDESISSSSLKPGSADSSGSGGLTPTILDSVKGCAPDCATVMSLSRHTEAGSVDNLQQQQRKDEEYFVVARTEALYFYGPDCLGPCLAFEGPKIAVVWLPASHYLVTIEDKPQLPFTSPPSTAHDHQSGQRSNAANILTVYDVENKFIAFSAPVPRVKKFFPQPCRVNSRNVTEDDSGEKGRPCPTYLILTQGIYLSTTPKDKGPVGQVLNNALLVCREKSTRAKLEILFRKNLYDLALGLVRTRLAEPLTIGQGLGGDDRGYRGNGPSPLVGHIFKLYGDHLYARGDFDNAMTQYCKTVGGSLEPSYVVRKYLDASKIRLLSTYLETLHAHLTTNIEVSNGVDPKAPISSHHTTLLINCYIKAGDSDKLDKFIRTQLPRLPNASLVKTIELLLTRPEPGYRERAAQLAKHHNLSPVYIKMEVEDNHNYTKALEYITGLAFEQAETAMKTYGRLFLTHLPDKTLDVLVWLCCDYGRDQRSSPEDFIHVFVNDSDLLTTFLERVIKGRRPSDRCSASVYNTLLELYLAELPHQASVDVANQQRKEAQILEILREPSSTYNPDQALILCQRFGFPPSVLSLLTQRKCGTTIHFGEGDIFEPCPPTMGNLDNVEGLVNRLLTQATTESRSHATLWTQALSQWSAIDKCEDSRNVDAIGKILAAMVKDERKEAVPSPLEIVKLLDTASGGALYFEAIKEYLMNHFQRGRDEIESNEKSIDHYTEQIERTEEQIKSLLTKPHVFQVSKCSACGHALETPAVYFLCHHGFHQNCYDSYGSSYDYNFNVAATLKLPLAETFSSNFTPGPATKDSRGSLIPTTNRSCCPVCFNADEEWKVFRKFNQLKEARDSNAAKYSENFHTQLERSCVWDGKLTKPNPGISEAFLTKDAEDNVQCENTFALLSKYLGQNVFEKIKLVTDKDIVIPKIQTGKPYVKTSLADVLNDHKNPFSNPNSTNPFPFY